MFCPLPIGSRFELLKPAPPYCGRWRVWFEGSASTTDAIVLIRAIVPESACTLELLAANPDERAFAAQEGPLVLRARLPSVVEHLQGAAFVLRWESDGLTPALEVL